MSDQSVFFMLGCVRSGTTLLRNLLKTHPNLACPEETHMFRWAEPYGSSDYVHVNKVADTLINHRQIDGVDEQAFDRILDESMDRKDFMLNYLQLFQQAQNGSSRRFFDKTPQNIYGLPLIRAYFPKAKIIHLVRNPLNVVTSLIRGGQLLPQNLIASINHWKESVLIINTLKPLLGDDLYEVRYEDLTEHPVSTLDQLMDFLQEPSIDWTSEVEQVHQERQLYRHFLDEEAMDTIHKQLGEWMRQYGYLS